MHTFQQGPQASRGTKGTCAVTQEWIAIDIEKSPEFIDPSVGDASSTRNSRKYPVCFGECGKVPETYEPSQGKGASYQKMKITEECLGTSGE